MNTTIFKTFITGRQAIAKIFIFTIAIVSVVTILVSCSARRNASTTIEEEGVVINGVRWATRNAEWHRASSSRVLHIFASSPEMPGRFFAPPSPVPLNETAARQASRARSGYISWSPCPPGWRLPTIPEFESLIAAGSVWTAVNGVYGRLFGTAPNQLFLPAAGKSAGTETGEGKGHYLVHVPRRTISPEGEEIVLGADPPPMAMIFCQESIAFSIVHAFRTNRFQLHPSYAISGQVPASVRYRIDRDEADTSPFTEVSAMRFPALSIRCVAVTADDE